VSASAFDPGFSGGFGAPYVAPLAAAGWPSITDVQNVLRVESGDTGDDSLVTQVLDAAIGWVQSRCDPQYTTPGGDRFLPSQLFTVAQYEAARLYRRRDSVDGTIGWGDLGVVRVGPKDPDIETLIAPFLAIVFA
jgi:hypothetical protein